ncbi:MAG: hypothetical protein ACXWDM_00145 [Nocardioides sp.]
MRAPLFGRLVVGAIVVLSAAAYRHWHLRWGATAAEVCSQMPGDDLVPCPAFTATRAITIDAPPEAVWPWLVQVGFGRAGFYRYDLLDNLGRHSAERILPAFQQPAAGDLAAPMTSPPKPSTSFQVAIIDQPHQLLWSKPDSTWCWLLRPLPDGRTRLVTRLRQAYRPGPNLLVTVPLAEIGDFPMMRRMLLGLRDRAERMPADAPTDGVLS